jgi:hypothetical protein
MHEVLFQTHEPTATSERVVFYDLRIVKQHIAGETSIIVQETRGWWDNEIKQAIFDSPSSLEFGPFVLECKALAAYSQRRRALASRGFAHAFNWHPATGHPASHRRINLGGTAEPL